MRELSIDIETYSSVDLAKSGVYAYAESPDFQILLLAYAWDNEPVQIVDLAQGEELPQKLCNALFDESVKKLAFNATFERVCIQSMLGVKLPIEQWRCTAVHAKILGLPNSLEAVGAVVGLSAEEQKLKTGKALIRYFCVPCKPTKSNCGRTRNLPAHDLERWELFKEYCCQDVEAERAIRRKIERFAIPQKEIELYHLDQMINDRGVGVDLVLAENAIEIDEKEKARLLKAAQDLTGLENPKSTTQLKGWIEKTAGIEVESLNKKNIETVKTDADNSAVTDMLDIRKGLSKTSTEKYAAMLRTVCKDGRIRGLTQFYGAGRTGRWAGRLVQLQNLPQNKMPDKSLDIAREFVKLGDSQALELLFDSIPDTLSQLIRTALVPAQGKEFLVADFSAIEARVLAWLAGEEWRLKVFRTHGKIYEASAEKMFHLPEGSVGKGDPMRQKGKIAELALGYGGSVGAMTAMGALDMGLKEEELKPIVNSWRAANEAITQFWWDVDRAVKTTIRTKRPAPLQYGMGCRMEGCLLKLRLPSGRELSYVKPRLVNDQIEYEGTLASGGWGKIITYGPKLVENITQAVARDCLAETMVRLEQKGFAIVFHVHDEVICEMEAGKHSVEEVCNSMAMPIEWAKGLPLKAEGYRCNYYKKA